MDFNALLKLMTHKRASDLFITADMPPTLKVDGKLAPIIPNPLTPEQVKEVVYSIMNNEHREEFERTHECNFAISPTNIGRFRVNVFQQRNHIGMVTRRIETRIPSLDELGMPQVLKEVAMTKRGLIIFVGGTGSGKSSSLAAMIGYRNQNSSGHIITIEDPIEFIHQHAGCIITQREVGVDTASYEMALKNTLRQAPDVILIGEIRSKETMEHAIVFAETGHLCLSTLHANSANQALDRIINFFSEDRRQQLLLDLSLNLRAIIAQRLIPRRDGQGRQVAVEVLINSPLVADLLLKGEVPGLKEVMRRSAEEGMKTFDQSIYDLYREDIISEAEALHYADSINDVRLMIKRGKQSKVANLEDMPFRPLETSARLNTMNKKISE
ncbi:Type IV pilus ATPase PilU [Gammaproteobacteria bacterium]